MNAVIDKITFWQPVLTEHARHTYEQLAKRLPASADVVETAVQHADRKRQDWSSAQSGIPVHVLDDASWRQQIIEHLRDKDRIHIFSSPFEIGKLSIALGLALARGNHVFLCSEPYSPVAMGYFNDSKYRDTLKMWLRPWLYRIYGQIIKARVKGIFAISPLAVRQFKSIGVPDSKIFPFGYFVPILKDLEFSKQNGKVKIAFVGSLIERKGVSTLISAMKSLSNNDVSLDVYGAGDMSRFLPLPTNTRYCGSIPFGTTQRILANYDILVVPSYHDGWAVVVNEAVLARCAVVATSTTGAGNMLEDWKCGVTFPPGDQQALAERLLHYVNDREALANAQAASSALAEQLAPERAAEYMKACIISILEEQIKPPNPWYSTR
jgi:glycosyltransferase involved in cell wall biosynthesis